MQKTEMRNDKSIHIDKMSPLQMLRLMNDENRIAVDAVEVVLPEVEKAVEAVAEAFQRGGRLFYIGAGTSGRMGVVDAAECPPTFGADPGMVVGIIAGGLESMRRASEDEEDNADAGIRDLVAYELRKEDIVMGISVAGNADYVLGAVGYAAALGCVTIGLTSNTDSRLAHAAEISICPDTGAEVITGSTRLKGGTAQKLILNMISTCAMIKQGYIYENLMINLKPYNKKLTQRVIRVVCEVTHQSEAAARRALEKKNWNIKEAIKILNGQAEETEHVAEYEMSDC